MADRIYPSGKPAANPTLNGATTTANPAFPATKAQLYGQTRPAYRPQPKPRRHRRSCCCCCFLWTTLFLIALALLLAIAGAVFWVLYRPHRPTFSLTTLRISQLNFTNPKPPATPQLNSKISLTVTARNPNKKITFFYDPILVSVTSNGVDVGDGSFPALVHGRKNSTAMKALITATNKVLDSDTTTSLKKDLKKKNGIPLVIVMDTKVKVKVGSFKTKKVPVKVTCDGIQGIVLQGKGSASSTSLSAASDPKCKVNLRIKIWKWNF